MENYSRLVEEFLTAKHLYRTVFFKILKPSKLDGVLRLKAVITTLRDSILLKSVSKVFKVLILLKTTFSTH